MATIANLKPDQVLYEVTSRRMGNTAIKTQSLQTIKVIEVNAEEGWVLARWGFNAPRRYRAYHVRRWKVNKPEKRETFTGAVRYGSRRKKGTGNGNQAD